MFKNQEETITQLNQEKAELEAQLETATDPAEIRKIYEELQDNAQKTLNEKVALLNSLWDDIELSSTKEECEKIQAQIIPTAKEIEQLSKEYKITTEDGDWEEEKEMLLSETTFSSMEGYFAFFRCYESGLDLSEEFKVEIRKMLDLSSTKKSPPVDLSKRPYSF